MNDMLKKICAAGAVATMIGVGYTLDALPVLGFQMTAHVVVADDREYDRLIGQWVKMKLLAAELQVDGKPLPRWLREDLAKLEKKLLDLGWQPTGDG